MEAATSSRRRLTRLGIGRGQAAKVSRRLALLHAHGLIAKISHTHHWQVTKKGRRILTALLVARQADTEKLISLAA